MVLRFERLYVIVYASVAYRQEAQGIVRVLQNRYGLAKREDAARPEELDEPAPDPEQVGFSW